MLARATETSVFATSLLARNSLLSETARGPQLAHSVKVVALGSLNLFAKLAKLHNREELYRREKPRQD
jgi:hypothetical protein